MIQNQNQIRLQNRPNYVVPCHTEQEPEVFIENQVRKIGCNLQAQIPSSMFHELLRCLNSHEKGSSWEEIAEN